jgi:hypothetical protein
MKKLKRFTKALLILAFTCGTSKTYAQETPTLTQEKLNVFSAIYPILDNAQKVYTPSGKYNQIQSWGLDRDNDCYYWFYSYSGTMVAGKENEKYTGERKVWVDFSKIKYVSSGTTNFGYKSVVLYGESESIKYQTSNFDDYGNRRGMGDFNYASEITLPIDSKELVSQFSSLAKLCKQERESKPTEFPGLTPPVNNYSTYEEPWIMKDEAPLIIGLAGGGIVVALLLLLL